jgi:hypothetical protein
MNLYRISQTTNTTWDTFDSAVVAAESEEAARNTHPETSEFGREWSWTGPENVTVEFIGTAKEGTVAGVICSSFNAG